MKDEIAIRNLVEACEAGRDELSALILGMTEEDIMEKFPTVPNVIAKMERAMQSGADYVNNKPARIPHAAVGARRAR